MFYEKFFEYYKQELEKQKAKYESDKAELKEQFESAMAELKTEAVADKEALQKDHEAKVVALTNEMQNKYTAGMAAVDARQKAAEEGMKAIADSEIQRLTGEYGTRADSEKADYEAKLKAQQEAFETKTKQLEDGFTAKAAEQKKAYDEKIAGMKAEYAEYCKGVATRKEFEDTQADIDSKLGTKFAEMDEFSDKMKRAVGGKIKAQDDKIAEVDKLLQASDAKRMSGKLISLEDKIDSMINPIVPTVIAILAFLIAAGLAVLMILDINPFKKTEEPAAETVAETFAETETEPVPVAAENPCKDGHTDIFINETEAYVDENGEPVKGNRVYICSVCGKIRVEETEPHIHAYDEGTVTVEPTLTETGIRTYTCSGCDESYTEEISALLDANLILPEDSVHPCKDSLTDLIPGTVALDPQFINNSLSEDYPFDAETMLWFVTPSGDGILVIAPANKKKAMETGLASLAELANVKGRYVNNDAFIFVQPDGAEPVPGIKQAGMMSDALASLTAVLGEAQAIGNVVVIPAEITGSEEATKAAETPKKKAE